MEMNVRMPANYNVMNEEEMTYTTGGASAAYYAALAGSLVVVGLLLYNWVDQLLGARSWYAATKPGNIGTALEKGIDTWLNYTTSSVIICVRSALATAGSLSGPIGWVVTAVAFATV